MTLRVGWSRRSYGAESVVYGARHPAFRHVRVPSLPMHAIARDPFWRATTVVAAGGRVDLVHLYNECGLVSRPWVASFEDGYPVGRRRGPAWRAALRLAASSRCRRVLAISEDARARLASDPSSGPALAGKCDVVWPCVPREDDLAAGRAAWLASHPPQQGPRLLFVGAQAFSKGLEFVLDALEPLAGRVEGLRLQVLSSFATDTYVTRADAARVGRVRARLAALPGASVLPPCTRREVRALMAQAHLLLFPTLDETFGFVVPEAMSVGLDVMTTDVRALPEILGPERARCAVALPRDAAGGWEGVRLWRTAGEAAYARAWEVARERCVEGLRARVARLAAGGDDLGAAASRLRARYEACFSPEALGARLADVYRRALAR